MALPLAGSEQAYCNVSALEAGFIGLTDEYFITNASPGVVTFAPSLSFLIQHSSKPQKFIFDLGIRKDWETYPPAVCEFIKSDLPVRVNQDVVQSLAKGGTSPTDIDTICFSHCHFDHVGDPSPFTNSTILVGEACRTLFIKGYPTDPDSEFAEDLLPGDRTRYISETEWRPLGPLPRTLDFYGDGSLYVVDAPGHLAGHVNILARTSPDGGWLYLAGDSAHHWNLITGASKIAVTQFGCAHDDKEQAEESIARIKALREIPRVAVIIAHDEPWYSQNKDGVAFWPGRIPTL